MPAQIDSRPQFFDRQEPLLGIDCERNREFVEAIPNTKSGTMPSASRLYRRSLSGDR